MHILFIHGAGEGAYTEDKLLADNLQQQLGDSYSVVCPKLPNEADAPYDQWKHIILDTIHGMPEPVILAGHSVGASILLKILSETTPDKHIAGIYLLATPFWGGDGWRYDGYEQLQLPSDIANILPKAPIYLYHCKNDEIVPFTHLGLYKKLLPDATIREVAGGNHQFNNDLTVVAQDITGA